MRSVLLVAFGAAAVAAPAASQPILFSAILKSELGYGTNPLLRGGVSDGSAYGSISFAPTFSYTQARAKTTLSGNYSRSQYLDHFHFTDTLSVALDRADQLTEHLTSHLEGKYQTTDRPTLDNGEDPAANDPLNIGQRSRLASGSDTIQWQATAHDSVNFGSNISRMTYGGGGVNFASNYTQYGWNASYSRVINARTSIGAQITYDLVNSQRYPQSQSYQPSVTLHRVINAIWTFDGHLGLVFQKIGGPFDSSSTSLGYGANLCGVYPRSRVCVGVDQQSSPSGFGGLRKDLNVHATFDRDLTEHSKLSFFAGYDRSSSSQQLLIETITKSRALQLRGDYSHDLSRRLSAGFGGRYQSRDTNFSRGNDFLGSAHAIAGLVNITAKLGRI